MGNDFDIDLGTLPTIYEDLIAFYPFSEFYDTIPGIPLIPDASDTIKTYLMIKKAKDLGPNEFDGFLRGGTLDTTDAPQPSVPDGKAQSPPVSLDWSDPPVYQDDRFLEHKKELNVYEYDGQHAYVEIEDEILGLKSDAYTIS